MLTWRPTVSSALAVMLAAGVATSAVLAQADEAQPAAGPFSATIVDYLDVDDMVWIPGSPHGRLEDWGMVVDVEASDPRLAGTWTMVLNGHGFGEPGTPESFSVYSGSARLENDDGQWVGEVMNFASDPYEHMRMVVEGEGAYAGLTAIIEQSGEFGEFQGLVFEYGLPPVPELPAE